MRILSTILEACLDFTPQNLAYHLKEQSESYNRPYLSFLDSSLIPDKYSRYSYIGWEPAFVINSNGYRNEFINTSLNIKYDSYCHPLVFLKKNLNDFIFHLPGQKKNIETLYISGEGKIRKASGSVMEEILPDFRGGFIGYFSYDLKDYIERLPQSAVDDMGIPIFYLAYYNRILAFDDRRKKWLYIRNFVVTDSNTGRDLKVNDSIKKTENIDGYTEPSGNDYPEFYGNPEDTVFSQKDIIRAGYTHEEISRRTKNELTELISRINKKNIKNDIKKFIIEKYLKKSIRKVKLRSNFTKKQYLAGVSRTKKYIYAGDIYQANFSQRFAADLQVEPMDLYYILREKNAAPFSAYLGFPGFVVGSSSPERFLYLKGDIIETRPIKGTRPRGNNAEEDKKLARELKNSIKDRAELNMIVDLERNDLGKFCYYGTVRVCEHAVIEKYSRVFHSVSTVRGKVKAGTDMSDIIRATFPGGSITGAPKIRAMEIIDELEPTIRSIYTGSIGYIGIDNTADLNIVIRTFIIKGSKFYYNVGGGIVADSDPMEEFKETMDKGSALQDTLRFFEVRNLKRYL